jgi:tRNA(adenine34) deaminase
MLGTMEPGQKDRDWMDRALAEARLGAAAGEVPVGAVVVDRSGLLAAAFNAPISKRDPTGHAEIRALRAAGEAAGAYRLPGTTLYVTLEPCLMCLGAAIHARIDRLVFGAPDPKVGATVLLDELLASGRVVNHRPAILGGVLAEEAAGLLRGFFRDRR